MVMAIVIRLACALAKQGSKTRLTVHRVLRTTSPCLRAILVCSLYQQNSKTGEKELGREDRLSTKKKPKQNKRRQKKRKKKEPCAIKVIY
jgi:hypothetical protein